jgi:TonB family protein
MLQATPTRGTSTTWVGGFYQDKQRRRLVIAVVLLLAAVTAVLVRDRDSWFGNGNEETVAADSEQVVYAPNTTVPPVPVAEVKTPVAANLATPVASRRTSSKSNPKHRTVHPASNAVKREKVNEMGTASARPSATWGPATAAAERASTEAQAHQQTASYPLLTRATAIQGAVVLQALISAEGAVEEMRVVSGPTILISAARQAVQQWRFKPYLLNGKAVETYARVTVNFTIDVSNTEARYHVNSVTSSGAL